MNVLITGVAGFIGHRLAQALVISKNMNIIGVDNLNNGHYTEWQVGRLHSCGIDVSNEIKAKQVFQSRLFDNLKLIVLNIGNRNEVAKLFAEYHFDMVFHFAAMAGVRDSMLKPYNFFQVNVAGFMNVIDACRKNNVKKVIFASSSSVYGQSKRLPSKESDIIEGQESFYAITKAHDEDIACFYAKSYGIHVVGLRLFTVYGPWGRPDMAPMIFANSIYRKKQISLFCNGDLKRDYTYVDDVIQSILGLFTYLLSESIQSRNVYFEIFNVGTGRSYKVKDFVNMLEKKMGGERIEKKYLPMQSGDVYQTKADTSKLKKETNCDCKTSLDEGLESFVRWFYSHLESVVFSVIAKKFNLAHEDIARSDNFITTYHADSLDLMDLIIQVEQRLQVKIPNDRLPEIVTVHDLLNAVRIPSNND